jgi:hypothetical protein
LTDFFADDRRIPDGHEAGLVGPSDAFAGCGLSWAIFVSSVFIRGPKYLFFKKIKKINLKKRCRFEKFSKIDTSRPSNGREVPNNFSDLS